MEDNETVEIVVPAEGEKSAGAVLAAQRKIVPTYCRWVLCGVEILGTTRRRFCSSAHQRRHWRMRKERSVNGVAEAVK